MGFWTVLFDVLILLTAAMILGGLCERMKQSAIVGYLLAGILFGPNALNWMSNHEALSSVAELGVSLLLFTIGLEFSWHRLRKLGALALGGGTLQVLVTSIAFARGGMQFGFNPRVSLAIGVMIALSSTACVLRLLAGRAEIDSIYGRNALGILLLQDVAVVPLVLVVGMLGKGGTIGHFSRELAHAAGVVFIFLAGAYLVCNYIVPRLLHAPEAARNRELPILLAIIAAIGAAWTAHRVELSPAIGAFIAGIILAGSPFAVQIRADVTSLKILFMTLFFSSIGMLADPVWIAHHWMVVVAVVTVVILGKAVLVAVICRLFGSTLAHSAATGVCLAQIGEFSFVLADMARKGALIDSELFKLIVSTTIATLILTPYLVAVAPRLAAFLGRRSLRRQTGPVGEGAVSAPAIPDVQGRIIVVGFGPAGQRVAEGLMKRYRSQLVVVELNPGSAAVAQSYGLRTYIGDASHAEILEHLHIESARMVAVTVPDPDAARQIIEQVRTFSPDTRIIARSRYHIHRWPLSLAGANWVVDEEEQVGRRIATEVRRQLNLQGRLDAAEEASG